jgi:hypothetical protein
VAAVADRSVWFVRPILVSDLKVSIFKTTNVNTWRSLKKRVDSLAVSMPR